MMQKIQLINHEFNPNNEFHQNIVNEQKFVKNLNKENVSPIYYSNRNNGFKTYNRAKFYN